MTGLIVFLLLVVLVIGYTVTIYNGLVRTRNEVKLAWSNIDVLLVQRHDELPKLIEVCKRYMQHERETLERVTQARSQVETARHTGDVTSVSAAEGALRSGLANLYAVAESYPELKADTVFRNLAARIPLRRWLITLANRSRKASIAACVRGNWTLNRGGLNAYRPHVGRWLDRRYPRTLLLSGLGAH